MARIGSYPIDAVIQDKDAWIGTQNTNRVTRQFTALGVAEYIDTKNVGLVFVGATNLLDGAKGLVPAPVAGQEGMYLKGNLGGGWTTIPVYTLDVPTGTTNVNLINTDGAGGVINSFITLTGGTYLTAVHTSGTQITFNHDLTTRTDTASASSPAAGGTVDIVSSVTSNATGHIEAVNIETVTWPADSDTTYTIDVPNATTSINLAGSDGTNDPIAFTTLPGTGDNGMTVTRTDANTLDFNSKWQLNTVLVEGYVPKGQANANKFWATDVNGNPGWTFQPSQDQVITSVGNSNITTGIELSQNGQTVFIRGAGTITASSDNTNRIITLTGTDQNTIYTLPVAAGAANSAIINLTDNAAAVVSEVTFNGTPTGIAISEAVGNNGSITIGLQEDITVTGELTVSGADRSSFIGQVTIPQTPLVGTDAASKAYVDGLVAGGLTFIGTFRADTGEILSGANIGLQLYNCPGGAGTRVAVAVGDYYIVATAAGSFYCSGVTLDIGDSIIATTAAAADASVVGEWSVVQSDEGVATFTNVNGTFVSASTVNTNAAGAVTMGTIDLSAGGTASATTFLRGDNTWDVPTGTYALPFATSTVIGGVELGSDTALTETYETGGVGASGQTYPVQLNAAGQAGVSVPWTNLLTSVTASGATTALSGLTSTPTTGAVVIGLDINGRASLGSPAGDDELMIYDTSTAKNVKVLVSDLASYAGSAATNQVTYWTSANNIGGSTGFTYAGGANGAVTMGGALGVGGIVTTDKIFVAKGQNVSHGASQIRISQEDTATSELRFYGADASTAGILRFLGSSSDGSVGGTRFTINSDGSSTFAGNVTVGSDSSLLLSNNATISANAGTNDTLYVNSKGNGIVRVNYAGGTGGFEVYDGGTNSLFDVSSSGITTLTAEGYQLAIVDTSSLNKSEILTSNNAMGFFADRANAIANSSMIFSIDNSTKLTIDSSGNGIFQGRVVAGNWFRGASNTNTLFSNVTAGTILQTAGATSNNIDSKIFFRNSNTTVTHTFDTNSGNSTFAGDVTTNGDIIIDNTSGDPFLKLKTAAQEYVIRIDQSDSEKFQIRDVTNNATRLTIDSSGNVGIGTALPSSKLTVSSATKGLTLNEANIEINSSTDTFAANIGGSLGFASKLTSSSNPNFIMAKIGGYRENATSGSLSGFLSFETRSGTSNVAERMRIDSSGNVGIGITPTAKLMVKDSSDSGFDSGIAIIRSANSQTGYINMVGGAMNFNSPSIPITFRSAGVERMRITSGGNVLMGNGSQANNSDGNLTLRDTQFVGLDFKSARTTGNIGGVRFYDTASDTVPEAQLNVEVDGSYNFLNGTDGAQNRMKITSGGNVLFGATDVPDGTSHYGSGFIPVSTGKVQLRMASNSTAAGSLITFFNPNGGVGNITITGTTTAYNTSSDYRLKEDLQDFAGLDMVSKIPVYDFKWKTDKSRSYGVMAHELQEVLPDAVTGEKDAINEDGSINPQGVDYAKIVPLLVKSIQELKAEIEILKNK